MADDSREREEEEPGCEGSVVDDDESVRESLPDLLGEFGFAASAASWTA